MNNAFLAVLTILLNLAALLFLLRFLLQVVRADFYNPLVQGIVSVTDPVLKPLRLALRPYRNLDFAAFVAAWGVLSLLGYTDLARAGGGSIPSAMIYGLFKTLMLVIDVFWWSILIGVIASFVAPGNYHPALQLVAQLTEPLMAPVRRILPATGGLDFSPLVVILGLVFVRELLPSLFATLF